MNAATKECRAGCVVELEAGDHLGRARRANAQGDVGAIEDP